MLKLSNLRTKFQLWCPGAAMGDGAIDLCRAGVEIGIIVSNDAIRSCTAAHTSIGRSC
jgi:hypothetical protein